MRCKPKRKDFLQLSHKSLKYLKITQISDAAHPKAGSLRKKAAQQNPAKVPTVKAGTTPKAMP
jgi:hypothetical protein